MRISTNLIYSTATFFMDINIGFEPITFSASDASQNFLFDISLKSFSTFFTDVLPLN